MTAFSHCIFKPYFSEMSQFVTHHGGDDFGFSACVSYASGMWGSYGPYMSRIPESQPLAQLMYAE